MNDRLRNLEAKLLAQAEDPQDTPARVDLLLELAEALAGDDKVRATALTQEAHGLAVHLSYGHGITRSVTLFALLEYLVSNFEAALNHALEARSMAEESGDTSAHAATMALIAIINRSLGNYEKALSHALQALQEIGPDGNMFWKGSIINAVGGSYDDIGDYERARLHYEQSLAFYNTLTEDEQNTTVFGGRALNGLGGVYQQMGDYERACDYFNQSLTMFRQRGDRLGEARALNDLGQIFQAQGDYERALDYHVHALALREKAGNKQAQSTSLINLGSLCILQGDLPRALEILHRALQLAMEIDSKPRISRANLALSDAYTAQDDFENALAHYKAYHAVKETVSGEDANARIKNIQISYEVEKAEQEAELSRLKNVELRTKNKQLEHLLHELKTTQQQLIQSEKMASLGRLTAGIAHEIKNPLNFVNNFSLLSTQMVDDLRAELAPLAAHIDDETQELLQDLLGDLKFNAEKINEHGRRADSIVKNMMQHASGKSGRPQPTDLNALLDENVNLSFHGMRASEPDFNVSIVRDYDPQVGAVTLIPQDIGRVFLNLLGNAFYAVFDGRGKREEGKETGDPPTVRVSTRRLESGVEIRVSDNGPGMPPEVREKIFEPFFTTKPSGAGTGLGLSLSYDIITQTHGGSLTVESAEGKGATFTILLPTGSPP